MRFKREKRTYKPSIVHWQHTQIRGSRSFCGRIITERMAASEDKSKITCHRCLDCMRLHDHLPKDE